MLRATILYPSRFVALKAPDNARVGALLKCPKCADRFRRPAPTAPADESAAAINSYWENAPVSKLVGTLRTAQPLPSHRGK